MKGLVASRQYFIKESNQEKGGEKTPKFFQD